VPPDLIPPHLRAELRDLASREDRARAEELAQWRALGVAVTHVFALPEWAVIQTYLQATRDGFREALEARQSEEETIFLRGQIRLLHTIQTLPAVVRAEIEALEKVLGRPDPEAGTEHGEATEPMR
jgi:hypothetical protein